MPATATQPTAAQLLASIKNQARRAVYDERDDSVHFEQFHWVNDEKIRQRILVERAIIRRAVRDILAAGFVVTVYDGEEFALKRSSSMDQIMANIGQCDEEWIYAVAPTAREDGKYTRIGGVLLVHGNGGWDVMADYSTGQMETLLAGANELADELGNLL